MAYYNKGSAPFIIKKDVFCIRYFLKTKSNPAEKLQSNVSQKKRCPHAKIQVFLQQFFSPESLSMVLHSPLQLLVVIKDYESVFDAVSLICIP